MSERALSGVLVVAGVYHVVQGVLMWVAPGTFFEQVGPYGARNDHYIGDAATFTIAAGVGLVMAASRPRWRVPLLIVGAVWYGLHTVNHVADIGEAEPERLGPINAVVLALVTGISVYLARVAARYER